MSDSTATGNACSVVSDGTLHPNANAHDMTLSALFDRFAIEVLSLHKLTSAKRERAALNAVSKKLGNSLSDTVQTSDAWGYRLQRQAEGAAPATIHFELRMLRRVLHHAAVVWGLNVPQIVVAGVLPRVKLRHERWLTAEELARVKAGAPPYLAPVITFAVETGCRISEICSLKWSQVDMQRGELKIGEQKNGKLSVLPLSTVALDTLLTIKRACAGGAPIFTKGFKPWTDGALRAEFYSAVAHAGVAPCRFHDLRHTFATRLVQAGVDLYTVQRLGRWSSYDMVQRYGHHNTDSLRKALEAVHAPR